MLFCAINVLSGPAYASAESRSKMGDLGPRLWRPRGPVGAAAPDQTRRRANKSLAGDAIVYILILIAVLAVVAGIMYAVAHRWGPTPEESQTRATRAYDDATGHTAGAERTA